MRTFLIALGLTALATSAIAADLPRKAPAVPPMQAVQAVNWTGFYIGVHSGYSWGRWLVVGATATLLPLELFEILQRPRPARVLVFVINAAIVVYLVRLAGRARRRTRPRDR